MPKSAILPNHLRPRREKVFGPARGISLDRNAKARIMVYARAWTARHRQPGQHRGPLTRAYLEVLEALLWGFHNSRTGLCFPSYEAIAAKAGCCRDTVYEAIRALEAADVLTWVSRIMRERVREQDIFGQWALRWRIVRTSNAYVFRDPLPCAEGREAAKSENPAGTLNQDISVTKKQPAPLEELDTGLLASLRSLGMAIAAREGIPVT
ncbi:MAG: helix-turn-helix domain-containing protein [Acetobacteraceae bacterium]